MQIFLETLDFLKKILLNLHPQNKLSDGVTGNTSGFGPEESRFDP